MQFSPLFRGNFGSLPNNPNNRPPNTVVKNDYKISFYITVVSDDKKVSFYISGSWRGKGMEMRHFV